VFNCSTRPHCSSCDAQTLCISCPTPYILYNQLCIIPCQADNYCLTCDTSNTFSCTQCITGYVVNSSGYCVQNAQCTLPINCVACNASGCTQCISQYYLASSQCVSCSSIINCSTCNSTGCAQCNSGYILMANQTSCRLNCTDPQAYCANCNITTNMCTVCNPNLTLTDGQCPHPPCLATNCTQCDFARTGIMKFCYICQRFTTLVPGGFCINCTSVSSGCERCNTTACLACVNDTQVVYLAATKTCNCTIGPNYYY